VDFDPMVRTVLGRVVLSQLLPYFVGRYADDRVLTRIKVGRKLEEFDSDQAFFESAILPLNRLLDDVMDKLPAALAGAKRVALQQAVEFGPYGPLL
jgi:hypothetical protein